MQSVPWGLGASEIKKNNKKILYYIFFINFFSDAPSPCDQCRSPLTLWVRIPLTRGILNTTLCDKVCQWLATDQWFFSGTLVPPPITESDCHNITEILLKVVLNTINLTQTFYCVLAILQWKYLKAMWLAIISWMWILEANIKVCFHYKMTVLIFHFPNWDKITSPFREKKNFPHNIMWRSMDVHVFSIDQH